MTAWMAAILSILVIGGVVALIIIIMRAMKNSPPVAYCPYCQNRLRHDGRVYICYQCEAAWEDDEMDDDLN